MYVQILKCFNIILGAFFLFQVQFKTQMYHFHLFTNPELQKIMGFIKDLSDPNCKFLKSYHRGPPTRFDIPAIKKKILLTI